MGTELEWSTEVLSSTVWIVGVYLATLIGCAVLAVLLSRSTRWGRQFRRLAFPYFSPRGDAGWRPLLTVLLILLLAIMSVRLNVLLSYQGNGMLTALQNQDEPTFWRYIVIFCVLATIHVVRTMFELYVQTALTIRWRVWLTDRMVGDWLDGRAYHKGRYTPARVDNPDQRIQEDIHSFPTDSVTLGVGAVNSLVSLVSFTLILWELSGPLDILGVEVPRAMTFLVFVFVIVASVFAFRIGRPLILLNFLQEQFNASFRYALVRLRENSENVAFQRGERVESGVLGGRFRDVIGNAWAILSRTIKFSGFNLAVSQVSVVLPYVIQAPRFFAGQVTLGDLNQTSTAFGQVHDALSFFRNAYDDFASYRAVLDRLTGLMDADSAARALPVATVEDGDDLQVRDLTVRRPDERVLVDDLDLDVAAGTSLLVTGPSGGGKTTLLRSLAQLWPYASGSVRRPTDDGSLFLPQQPYLPLGTLRDALAYPGPADEMDDARAAELLREVQLPQLADHLDEVDDWARRLSPGEQQRLGFARILVVRPKVVFLDEATSALDEGLELSLYNLLREELPDTAIVSVGHRSSLRRVHDELLELDADGRWERSALQH
ncbi:ABC transporter ATP-binding protein/permease [Pseudonocardia adelaidensis]|uniref:ABC transporter ATP-binding protein/permease n=1 Tax=Pseudonocardia adelaidensis TaxID=648754 RepID=A0ABP9NHT7_9PSEU